MRASRPAVVIGVLAGMIACGVAAIAANFGILSRSRDVRVGRLEPPVVVEISSTVDHEHPTTTVVRPTTSTSAPSGSTLRHDS